MPGQLSVNTFDFIIIDLHKPTTIPHEYVFDENVIWSNYNIINTYLGNDMDIFSIFLWSSC